MKLFSKNLIQHKTFRNVGYLTIGNVLAQAISLIGAFYIPKLLGPEQYGIYNTVLAYVGLFSVFTFSGLNKVIIREAAKDTEKTKEILEATIGLRNAFSLLAAIFAILIVLFIDYDVGTKIYIFIFSFSLLFKGIHGSINTIFQSQQKMKILGVVSVVQQLFRVPLSILFLLLGYGVISLIWLHLITEILVSFVLYKSSQKIIVFNFFSRVKFLKEYIYSGMRFSLLEFFSILSGKVDLVMLSFLTTPANVGIYALAYRLVDKGLTLRGPISQSLFPYYADRFHKKKPQIRELAFHTALISIPLIIFLIPASLLIKPIIVNIIGASFIESAKIFNVLVFYLILNFSVIPWGLYLQSTNNEKYVLYTATLTAFLNIALNILFFQLFGIIGIAYSTLLVQSINMITQQFLTVYQIKRQF